MTKSYLFVLFALAVLPRDAVAQNLLLEGDFEGSSSEGCFFNANNAGFTEAYSNRLTAFGDPQEICIMKGECSYGTYAHSGETKIGLAGNPGATGNRDAFSFSLSIPIFRLHVYELSGWVDFRDDFGRDPGYLEIGLSDLPDAFGTLVATLTGPHGTVGWDLATASFIAPMDAQYLTVRVQSDDGIPWVHIDDFVLEAGCGGREGTVNAAGGGVRDVLFLNGSAGEHPERVVEYRVLQPFRLEMRRPPSIPEGEVAPYAVYLWPGNPATAMRALPFGIGCMELPSPLAGGSPQPAVIWNNAGSNGWLGVPSRPSDPAPSVFFSRQQLPRAGRFVIQGVIYDLASRGTVPASVTNAIVAVPTFD